MGDVIFVLATVAFFAICVSYVNWCDRIIGPDEFESETVEDPALDAAPTQATGVAA